MSDAPRIFRITLKGRLDRHWSESLQGLGMIYDEEGNTTLVGSIADQAALHGLLITIRDLGIPLLKVEQIDESSCCGF